MDAGNQRVSGNIFGNIRKFRENSGKIPEIKRLKIEKSPISVRENQQCPVKNLLKNEKRKYLINFA